MGEIVELFKKLWEDNIKTNYKKISISLSSFLSTIILLIIYYVCDILEEVGTREALLGFGILVAVNLFVSGLLTFIFGKAQNGNGYNMPETKAIVDLIKKDAEFREMAKQKLLEHLNNGSKLLNHDDG